MAGAKSRHIENRGGTGKEGARCMWPFLLECILQNMVRHFVTREQVRADGQINDTLFRQRITAGSATDV